MKLTPYLIFVLLTGGLVAFIYKDQLFPSAATDQAGGPAANARGGGGRRGGGGGGGGFRRGNQIVPVVAEKASTGNVPVYLNGVGTVQAFNTATVRTQVSGRLIDVPYTEGQEVKEGDVLARVDPVVYQAAYDQAIAQKAKDEALLANARLDEKRFANLVKTNAATQQQADTAFWTVNQDEAQVKLDQAQIDNAKANLDYATIKAPLTGRTGIRLVDKGNLVSPSDATGIVIITQLRPIAVVFTLPENTVSGVLDAQALGPVELQAIAAGKVIGDGKLLVVDNQIDQSTGTYKIKGTFPNEQNRLWPGQFVNVKLKLKVLQDVIVIPSVAVQQGPNGSYVYTVTPESTVKVTNVSVIQEGERQTVIGSGINAGDTVVTAGFANLQDGTKVKLDTDAGAGQAAANPPPETPATGGGDQNQRSRRGDAAAGGGAAPNGEQRHRRRQSQAGEQAGSVVEVPAGQGKPKP
jgi:membrane fusion protein, multidrug efflux system